MATIMTITDGTFSVSATQAGLDTDPDYTAQIVSAAVQSVPNLQTRPATWRDPQGQIPASTGWELALAWLQDWSAPGGGLSQYCFDNDTELVWFRLSPNNPSGEPIAEGQAYVGAASFLGDGGVPLQANATWPVEGKPSITSPAVGP